MIVSLNTAFLISVAQLNYAPIIRKLWNSLQNKLNSIYKRDTHFKDH